MKAIRRYLSIPIAVVAVVGLVLSTHQRHTTCHDLLEAMDRYSADRKSSPGSIQNLIDLGYLEDAPTEACRIPNWGR